jgi:hypothetical protein
MLSLLLCLIFLGKPAAYANILNTVSLSIQPSSTYAIGYLPPSFINPTSNASACRRVSMFKFPSAASGTPSLLKLNFVPNPNPISDTCYIGLGLFDFQNNSQIGSAFIGQFNVNANNTVDISKSGWVFVRGSLYYLQVQAYTNGQSCIIRLPYNTQTSAGTVSSTYSMVAQQGPLNQPCGSSPWATVATLNGGYIPMEILLQQPLMYSPTPTNTPSPSSTDTPSPSATQTPSPSVSQTPSPSVSQTPSPSVSQTPSPSTSQTPFPSTNHIPTQSILSNKTILNNLSSNGLVSSASQPPNGANIAAGVIGALVLSTAVAASIIQYKNRNYVKQSRSPVTSSNIIVNNPVQMKGISESTIYAHRV